MGESQFSGCGGAMMSTSSGATVEASGIWSQERMLSRVSSDVSLENPIGWLGFLVRWLQVLLLVPFKDSMSYFT